MKELSKKIKKIAGGFISCAGFINIYAGIHDNETSTILIGIAFCIIGILYLLEDKLKKG